jgi:hypothetical protein
MPAMKKHWEPQPRSGRAGGGRPGLLHLRQGRALIVVAAAMRAPMGGAAARRTGRAIDYCSVIGGVTSAPEEALTDWKQASRQAPSHLFTGPCSRCCRDLARALPDGAAP